MSDNLFNILRAAFGLPPYRVPTAGRLIVGDCLEALKKMPGQSVHCCVTSPPYYALRNYGVKGQIGVEDQSSEYVQKLIDVFTEVHRVMRNDGVLWVNISDTYASSKTGKDSIFPVNDKSLLGVPWRFALAMISSGWILRQDIIWNKPNALPESVKDRCTKSHEYIFMFTKSAKYHFDAHAIKECAASGGNAKKNKRSVWTVTTRAFKGAHTATFPVSLIEPCVKSSTSEHGCCEKCGSPYVRILQRGAVNIEHQKACGGNTDGKYAGKATKDYAKSKAQDPSATKARILAGMVEKKTVGWRKTCSCDTANIKPCVVLDPFGGSGTTGIAASKNRCDFVLCELNTEYADIAATRIEDEAGLKVLRSNV
jgi:site-specific DNA-methyltransferase (adenine-specific)